MKQPSPAGQPQIKIVGMAWYREEDFPAIRTMMLDGRNLHPTWKEWQQAVLKGESQMLAEGARVYRAIIDPHTFGAWCSAHGLNVDSHGRNQFASEFAMQEYRAGR